MNIINEKIMSYVYEKDSCLYWKNTNSPRALKNSLAGYLNKSSGYYRVRINGKDYLNHRILFQIYNNVILKETDFIDHINGITTDNRKENLRLCTHSQNQMNQKPSKNNKIGIKNIYLQKTKWCDYYRIQIKKDGKHVFNQGYRTDEYTLEEIIKIRDEKLKEIHGEFCNIGHSQVL